MPGAERLDTESALWVEAGLISPAQRDGILAWDREHRPASRSLAAIISIAGAVVVVLGVVLVVATNWQQIPLLVKLYAGVALLVSISAAGYRVRFGPRPRERTGEALLVVGAGVFLADLALVSQQYQVFHDFSPLLLLFWVLVAPLPYLLRSRALAFVSAATLLVWIGLESGRDEALLFAEAPGWFVVVTSAGVAMLALGVLHRAGRFAVLAPAIELAGGAALLFGVYVLGFFRHLVWFGRYSGDSRWDGALLAPAALTLVVAVPVALVLAAMAWAARREDTGFEVARARLPLLAAGAVLLAVVGWCAAAAWSPRADAEPDFFVWTAGFWLLTVALSAVLTWAGVMLQRRGWVNVGLVFAGLFTLTRYFDLFNSYGQTGLLFIGAGVLLFVVAFVLERSRRALTRIAEEMR